MFRSQPIPMIKENKQLCVLRMAFCYSYSVGGEHSTSHSSTKGALRVKLYGLNKDGDRELIAICQLVTDSSYTAMDPAACVCIAIPIVEYNAIVWEYDKNELGYTSPEFTAMLDNPVMFFEEKEYSDRLSDKTYSV